MKLFRYLVGVLLLFLACSVSPTTVNGRFTVLEANSTRFTVLLQINANNAANELGGTTMLFEFDTTAISIINQPVKDADYFFHNFDSGNYSSATVTRPMNNQIWVNIDLPYTNSNNGTVVAEGPDWTDVVTIHFDVVDPYKTADLNWLTGSLFWGVYDSDNSTLWETGIFEDFPTSVEPGNELPAKFDLSQNYPNPFNPSTKIKFEIPGQGQNGNVMVTLRVYDILGNEVATLVDEEKSPGIYEVSFNSHSGEVQNLSSGIYIYRLQSADFVETKKMMLLK